MDINDMKKKEKKNEIIHMRQDSATELENLFKYADINAESHRKQQIPMRDRNLPESFFNPPKMNRKAHHNHSQSLSVLVNNPQKTQVDHHSRSSSSDSSNTSMPISSSSNINNNNAASMLVSQQLHRHLSPSQRRIAQLHPNQNFPPPSCLAPSSHNRSKSSPASLQLGEVKPSDIPPNMPLPHGWGVSKTGDGQNYFLNHINKTTTWEDPRITIIKQRRMLALQQQHQQQQQHTTGVTNTLHPVTNESGGVGGGGMTLGGGGGSWVEQQTQQVTGGAANQQGGDNGSGNVYFINQQQTSGQQHEGTNWMDNRVINMQQQQTITNQQQRNPQLGQMLKQPGGMDPFLSSGVSSNNNSAASGGYHQQLDQVTSQNNSGGYVIQQQPVGGANAGGTNNTADEYMTGGDEEMDTSAGTSALNAGVRRVHMNNAHMGQLQQTTQQTATGGRGFDFLDGLPSSNIDYPSAAASAANNQQQSQVGANMSTAGANDDGGQLIGEDFNVNDVLNAHAHVKTENENLCWL